MRAALRATAPTDRGHPHIIRLELREMSQLSNNGPFSVY